jgi:hypothetical protein
MYFRLVSIIAPGALALFFKRYVLNKSPDLGSTEYYNNSPKSSAEIVLKVFINIYFLVVSFNSVRHCL